MRSRQSFRFLILAVACLTVFSSARAEAQIQRSVINASFEQPTLPSACWAIRDEDVVNGWETTDFWDGSGGWGPSIYGTCAPPPPGPPIDPIQVFRNGFFGSRFALQGQQYVELNALRAGRLYQNVCMATGEQVTWSLAHAGRGGSETMRFTVGPDEGLGSAANTTIIEARTSTAGASVNLVCGLGTCNPPQEQSTQGNNWGVYSGQFTWTGASGMMTLGFEAVGGATTGNFLDDIHVTLLPYVELTASTGTSPEAVGANLPGIRVSGAFTSPTPVRITITGGTATLGTDYTTPSGTATFDVSIPAGEYDGSTVVPLPLTILDDPIAEPGDTITFEVQAQPALYTVAATQSCGGTPIAAATYTIADDEVVNLAITKDDGVARYAPGDTLVYRIVVRNLTTSTILGAQITDPLPAGITSATWTCGSPTGGGLCHQSGGSGGISATADFPGGSSVTYTLTMTVPATYRADLTNTATVAPPAPLADANPGDNSAADTDTQVRADLSITKTSTPKPYAPGSPFTYTIVVSNAGPDTATGAVITDPLPQDLDGFTWTCAASGAGASCGTPGGTVTGTPPTISTAVTLPPVTSATITVTGTLPLNTTGTLINTATVTPPATLGDPTPRTSTDANPVGPTVDLRVGKVSSPNPYVPGLPLTYILVVTNDGPEDAVGALVEDAWPLAGVTWTCVASGPPGTSCGAASGSGNLSQLVNLPAGGSVTYTATTTVPTGRTGQITNAASVTAPATVTDIKPGNNVAADQNPVGPQADLGIAKMQSPDPYVPGQPITYTMVVTNNGPGDVAGARVQDTPDTSLTNVTWTCVPGDAAAACATPGGVSAIDTLVTLPVGTSVTFAMTADVPVSRTGVLTNSATVRPPIDVTDPDPSNDDSTVNSGPAPEANLSIVKSATPNPFVPGGPLTFTLEVSNAGPSDAPRARVLDRFPPALSGFTWTCAPTAGAAACGVPSGMSLIDVLVDLPVGGAVTFTATGVVPSDTTGMLINTATVTPPLGVDDPDPSDNASTVSLGAGAEVDLRVTKTSTPNPYVPGGPLTYTVTFANHGPSALLGGRVRDALPEVIQNATWTCLATGGTCPAASGAGNIDALVDIAPGGTVAFIITGNVPAETRGTLTNVATIVPPAGVTDPTPSDNTAIDSNPAAAPGGPADLRITQVTPSVAPPNGLLTFRLVTRNLGSHAALNPYVTGMIPPGTTFVSAMPSAGGTCTVPGNPPPPHPGTGYPIPGAAVPPLTCTWPGLMNPGDTHSLEFIVRVAPGTRTGQVLWSCWWTWSQTDDPYHANNVIDAYLFVHDGVAPAGDLALQGATLTEGVVGTERPVRVGEAVPLRFWATNHGPAQARGQYALILDTANTIEILDVKVAQGWISPHGPASAVWDTGPVLPGQTVAVDLTIRLRTTSAVKLLAQRISGQPGDPNAANEHAEIVLDGYGPAGTAGRWVTVGNVDGVAAGEIVTGAGQGESPQVRVFTGAGADTGTRFFAYERPFTGGVQVASCDVDGDGLDEVITAPGPGRAPTIRVLRVAGGVVTELTAFDAFEEGFAGGVSVACADLDADGSAEIVVGAGPGRAPEVKVYNAGLSTLTARATFLAYEDGFRGGVRVAAGAYAGRMGWLGAFQIATTPGAGRPADLRMWDLTGAPVAQMNISAATQGVIPTLGDADGDGDLDLVAAPDNGRPELVRIFDVDTGTLIGAVAGGDANFPDGVRIALGVLTGGPGASEIVVGNGPGGHPRVRVVFWPPAGPVLRLEILPLEIP